MLGEFAGADINLTSAAQGTPAANRIDIDAKRPCRLQYGSASRYMPLASRGREDNLDIGAVFSHRRAP